MNRFPWWGSVLLAVLVYHALKYGAAELLPEGHRLAGLLQLLAPLSAMALLLLAGKQLYDQPANERESAKKGDRQDKPGETS